MTLIYWLALLALVLTGCQAGRLPSPAFQTGVDANYALEMSRDERPSAAVLGQLAAAGATHFRVRLWTNDNGPSGLHYATITARQAQAAGMKPYLVLFLSDNWADLVKQPVPEEWKGYSEADKLAAIEAYAALVAKHFRDAGVDIDTFEIGNEIDFGLCGVFEEDWAKRVSVEFLSQNVWPKMVPMIAAAQRGVKRARPDAKFVLHLAQWDRPDHCAAFFRFMLDRGIDVDYAGLSYFPTSAERDRSGIAVFMDQAAALSAATGRRVLVCEYAYPALPQFGGQFGEWNKPALGYPLSDDGQSRWMTDFLAAARANPSIAGAYYWSPEWNDSPMWHAFSLFDPAGRGRPALGTLRRP